MPTIRKSKIWPVWTLLPLLLSSFSLAQEPAAPPVPAEIKVSRVDIQCEGPQSVSVAYILANVHIAKGGPFSSARLDQSIRSLYATGLFEFVEAAVEKTSETEVAVKFKVRPKFKIREILFRGNEKLKTSRLINEVAALPGKFLDELVLKKDRDTLLELYRKKGYAKVEVDYETQKNAGQATVIFHIAEDQKVKIRKVAFEGDVHNRAENLLDGTLGSHGSVRGLRPRRRFL